MVPDAERMAPRGDGDHRAHVVIIYRNALFAQGIASLLRAEGVPDVLRVSASEPTAAQRVRALEPSVIIIEGRHEDTGLLLAPLLDMTPWVIRVDLEGAPVDVYRRAHLVPDSALVRLVTRLARRAEKHGVEIET